MGFSRVRYWRIQKTEFELGHEPSEASRFNLEFSTEDNQGGMQAARENCAQLAEIFMKHINSRARATDNSGPTAAPRRPRATSP